MTPPPAEAPAAPTVATAPPPEPEPEPRSLPERLSRLAEAAAPAGIGLLHLLLPGRDDVLGPAPGPALRALEQAIAAAPGLAPDVLPLRHAFAAAPLPLWRRDGHCLSVEGGLAVIRALLAALKLRHPAEAAALARAEAILARADLPALPHRDLPAESGSRGIAMRETEPALTEAIFSGLPPPRRLAGQPGLEAWASPGAPLPWRVVLLAPPGLGASAHPASPGWWLRWLAAECVLSEALESAPAGAVLGLRPGLVLTLLTRDHATGHFQWPVA